MIEAVTVERFRGLRRLEVEGLGRVNLIIGKNDCGKTALMEAIAIAQHPETAGPAASLLQHFRRPGVNVADFERCWQPMFLDQDARAGFSIALRSNQGSPVGVSIKLAEPSQTVFVTSTPGSPSLRALWSLDIDVELDGGTIKQQITATSAGLEVPTTSAAADGWWWVKPSKTLSSSELRAFSRLKQRGREADLYGILRMIDDQVHGIEFLAPTGGDAELFVRLKPGSPLLPLAMMGDGFQRCFELGVGVAGGDYPFLGIDEFDNGLHHAVLEPVWRWLAAISAERGIQVFATTHSEECIQAACSAFAAVNDDGLRVIRLTREEEKTIATVYDRALVEAATRMDVEIRG
jgi:hypothetical protein